MYSPGVSGREKYIRYALLRRSYEIIIGAIIPTTSTIAIACGYRKNARINVAQT